MKSLNIFGLCFGLLVTFSCRAELTVIPAEYQYCTVCHGTMLQGNHSNAAPAIAGLPAWFVEQELLSFKKDWRGTTLQDFEGGEMYAVAKNLDSEQIKAVAKLVSDLPPAPPMASIEGDQKKGAELFSACASCHGVDAKGNAALGAPPLLLQSDWYLKSQLEKFHSGIRGRAEGDQRGLMMASSAQLISSDGDINNLISYINTLKKGE